MNKIDKMAQSDAARWAAAEMFFGDGAGTRRKLLWAEINKKLSSVPQYKEAFEQAYQSQDFAQHAINAERERRRIDRAAAAGRNIRALKNGNIQGLTTGVFVVAGAVYVAHATGYDQKIKAEAQRLYKKARIEVRYRKARAQGKNVTKII